MSKPVIMIVDDEIANIEIMGAVLGEDYEICFSRSGEDALRVVQRVTPDLILLDIVMPGLDGYEVCRKLKDDPATADITRPAVLISKTAFSMETCRIYPQLLQFQSITEKCSLG